MDLDGSVLIMDKKSSIGANHAGVCMVFKIGTAFSLDSRSREVTLPGCLYGSYGLRVCDPPASGRPTARHQFPVAELQEYSVLVPS